MSSRSLESCDVPGCACEHHGGLARHLVYGQDYQARAEVHRAATGTPQQDRTAIRAAMSGRVRLAMDERNVPTHRKLTDRSPA